MYRGFKHLHSFIAYLALILLILSVIYAFNAFIGNKTYTKRSKTIITLGLVGTHTQLVVGFVLYFLSPLGISNFSGEMMKNGVSRLYALEHPLMMMIAIVLITVGFSKSKRAINDRVKFKTVAIFYGVGLILILSRIPWNSWSG